MRSIKSGLAGLAFALALATPAAADVTYQFSGFGSDFNTTPATPNAFALAFVYDAPSFFVTNADPAPAAGLTSCSADPPYTCVSVSFLPDSSPITGTDLYDMVFFHAAPNDTTWFFYFANGILDTPGTYSNVLLIGFQDATLTISDEGDNGVPEPGTLALLAIALVGARVAGRARGRTCGRT